MGVASTILVVPSMSDAWMVMACASISCFCIINNNGLSEFIKVRSSRQSTPLGETRLAYLQGVSVLRYPSFTDQNVYFMATSNVELDNNYRDSLFQILPRGTFEIHDEFIKLRDIAGPARDVLI